MNIIAFYGGLIFLLFAAVFVTKRRFGMLGLALAAGSLLGDIWGYTVTAVAPGISSILSGPKPSAIILSAIVLLPAVILLFHGNKCKTVIGRFVNAALFTVLAMAFLVEPLSQGFVLQGVGGDAYNWLINNKTMVIGFGLIIAVIDLFFTKPAQLPDNRR